MLKSYGERTCLWCDSKFTAIRSNMVYCNKDCCKKATNQKIIDRYHANKAKKLNNDRKCDDCQLKLSKYNNDKICNSCQRRRKDEERIDLLRKLGFSYTED